MPEATVTALLVALPAAAAVVIAALPKRLRAASGLIAMAAMLAVLALALRAFVSYGEPGATTPLHFDLPFIASLGINLHFAIDGFNLYLVLLSALLFPVVLGCSWQAGESRHPLYLALLLVLETSLLGTFLAQNLLLFFVFWEAVLIPAGVLILVFGGRRRAAAATAFFLYTLAGSVLLLAAVIGLGAEAWRQTGSWSFEFDVLSSLQLSWETELFVFVSIMLACLVKCPLVPLHSWLPLAYCEAPPSVTALMAGALSKMGALGILKLALPLAPAAARDAAPYMVLLAVTSILYGALLALRQEDYKKLVAYSSLSHMGYIVLGIFSFQQTSIHGSLLQMLSHGVTAAGLFLLLGLLQQRRGPAYLQITALSTSAPRFAALLMMFVLAALALPLTSGFTAEFMILFGALTQGLLAWRAQGDSLLLPAALLAFLGMTLGAAYMLRFARAILFGKTVDADPQRMADLRARELAMLAPPLVLILWIGIAPASIMGKVQAAVTQLVAIGSSTTAVADARSDHDR